MRPALVVETLDVLEDRAPRVVAVSPDAAVDELALEGGEEGFGQMAKDDILESAVATRT